MKLYFFIVLSLCYFTLQGCKKSFEHDNTLLPLTCECCEKVDGFEGTYEGRLIRRGFFGFNPSPVYPIILTTVDTIIHVSLERTFDGLNAIEDSMVCAFYVSDFFDEPIRFTEELLLKGEFYPKKFSNQQLKDDTLRILSRTSFSKSDPKNPFNSFTYVDFEFKGVKI